MATSALLPVAQPMSSPNNLSPDPQEFGFEFPPPLQDFDAPTRQNSRPDSIGDSSCRTRRPRSLMFFLSPSKSKARLRQGNGDEKRINSALNLSTNVNDDNKTTGNGNASESGNGNGNGNGNGSRLAQTEIPERRRSAITPGELQRECKKKGDNVNTVFSQPHTSLHAPAMPIDSELKPSKIPKSKLKNRASVINSLRKLFRPSKAGEKSKVKGTQYTPAETPVTATKQISTSREPGQDLDRINEYFTDDLAQFRSALDSPPHTQEARRECSSAARQNQVSSVGIDEVLQPASAKPLARGVVLPPALQGVPSNDKEDDSSHLAPPNAQTKRSSNFRSSPFRSLLRLSQHTAGSTTSLITDRRKETYVKINLTPTNLALLAKEWEAIDQAEKEKKGEKTPEDEARKKKEELWQAIAAAEGDDSAAQKALAARAARRERVQRHVGKWLEGIIDDEEAVNEPQKSPAPSIVRPFSS